MDNWENIKVSNFYFKKLKVIELCNMIFTCIFLGNAIVIYELDYMNKDGRYDNDIDIQLWISLVCNIILLVTLNYRYVIYLNWEKSKTYISKYENLYTTGYWK